MKFPNYIESLKKARRHKNEAQGELGGQKTKDNVEEVDPVLFKYFFDHQFKMEKHGEIKKGGGIDYHTYARKMWEDLIGPITSENEEFFKRFTNQLIVNLHEIDMEPLVYEHISSNLTEIIGKYKNLNHVALWSTGDVEGTGYQVAKVVNSKIVGAFHKALKTNLSSSTSGEFLKDKTSFLVTENKVQALVEYALSFLEKNPDKKIKIVIIEDLRKNFDKVKDALQTALGEKFSKIEIIPIWATYSREGKKAEEAALISPQDVNKLSEQKNELNSISTFEDLLDTSRFGKIFDDAHVFVDFDGVIGDNTKMREEQAKAIWSALHGPALESTGFSPQSLLDRIKTNITKNRS